MLRLLIKYLNIKERQNGVKMGTKALKMRKICKAIKIQIKKKKSNLFLKNLPLNNTKATNNRTIKKKFLIKNRPKKKENEREKII